jgi:hypothetical protein
MCRSPALLEVVQEELPLLAGVRPRDVVRAKGPGPAGVESEVRDPLGMGPGEQQRHGSALQLREQRGLLRAGGVHHRLDVVHLFLERGHRG